MTEPIGLGGCGQIKKGEALLLGLVLVVAFHAIPQWVFNLFPTRRLYDSLGANWYGTLYDAITGLAPLLLCLGAPSRCGLKLGVWRGHTLTVIAICLLPVVLTAIIYPFTSRPFSGLQIGIWLVSPFAQDLLFTGYLYGLFDQVFPGVVHQRMRINKAVIVTALFFALWHTPNFGGMPATYVSFQLLYTFLGGAWILLARQLTGSILPGLLTHMACNFIAWL